MQNSYSTATLKGATRNPSRRTFLKIAPAAAVAAAAAEANASPAAVTKELAELIARYSEAQAVQDAAYDRLEEIRQSEEFCSLGKMRLREVVSDASEYPPRMLDVLIHDYDQISHFFESVNGAIGAVVQISKHPVHGMSAEESRRQMARGDDFRAALDLLEKRQDAIAEWEKRAGVPELERVAYDRDRVSLNLFNEILEFPCRTTGDVAAKVEFAKRFMHEDFGGDQFLTVLESMRPAFGTNQPLHA